jgi:threonine synthase
VNRLICISCRKEYGTKEHRWRCDCGYPLDLDWEPAFPLEKLKQREPTLWRYREAIPLDPEAEIVSFAEGFTPLIEVEIAGKPILVKQEQLFGSGSFKDRGAAVLVSNVKSLGIRGVVADSSGNAGASIAAYCAAAGIACRIFVPARTSPGKVAQIRRYGAQLTEVPGTREDTAAAVLEAAHTAYYASHYWNPFFFHGTKTFAFEVCEQLGWKPPDTLILPVGNGSLILGAYTGFRELHRAGIIAGIPRLIGVQAEQCAPLYHAFKSNPDTAPPGKTQKTAAEGIAVAAPLRGTQIIAAVRQTHGDFITVSEEEIKYSLQEMGRRGHYIEPTSAAATAGIDKYLRGSSGKIARHEVIVSAFTGHGLKAGNKTGASRRKPPF